MTNLQKKIASAVAAGALLFNSFVPVFAQSTTLLITGNGSDSDNDTNVSVTTTTTVVQSNTADISNNVDAEAETGGNEANENTGGDVSVSTGDASTGVAIENTANSNVAEVDGCCALDTEVEISGNGSDSDNEANLKLNTTTDVFQDNDASIKNTVDADSETGENEANENTGGDVSIETGVAETAVLISNEANSNVAHVGGGDGNGSVSLKILGNGTDSDNDINLLLDRSLLLSQSNFAKFKNDVDAEAETGENEANENTGGDVEIKETGDASTGVIIDNLANFNFADLNCGCLLDVLAKVAGNGADSDNEINAALSDSKAAFQTNEFVCGGHGGPLEVGLLGLSWGGHHSKPCNDVDAESDTGDNEAEENTGGVLGGDPTVETGDAETLVELSTTANSNVLTEGGDSWELPEFDFEFDFGSNWALWWGWLSGNSS